MTEDYRRRKLVGEGSRAAAMQAVILAGGLGTRMRPITEKIPKPMIPAAGKPFLQHQVELLSHSGISDVLLLVSYLGEQIETYFGNGEQLGSRISYSYEPSPLGTGGALSRATAKLHDSFVLLNGDTYLDIDYQMLLSKFAELDCLALIVAYGKPSNGEHKVPADFVQNNLGVQNSGCVIAYRKKDPDGLTHIDAGVVVLSKKILQWLPKEGRCSLEEEIYPRLIAHGQMQAWVTTEPFYDMGSPEGLAALEEKLR